jgi:enoyl-CoA hydratase/carnithine racemase
MGIPTAKMGIVGDCMSFQRVATAIGYSQTIEIFLTGRFYDAHKCLEMGLVNHVVESDRLEPFTYDMAQELAENAPLAVRDAKYIIDKIERYNRGVSTLG